jgi:hypothetical protein
VLLWLDDLDDVLFSAALVWERLRRALLQIGLLAALGLAATDLAAVASAAAPLLSTVAAATVGAWLLGAAAYAVYHRDARESLTAA